MKKLVTFYWLLVSFMTLSAETRLASVFVGMSVLAGDIVQEYCTALKTQLVYEALVHVVM